MSDVNKSITGILAVILLISGMMPLLTASGEIAMDQTFTLTPNSFDAISLLQPIGQEFTPIVNNLVAVDLVLAGYFSAGTDTVTVTIRSGSITGPILGSTSKVVTLSSTNPSTVPFDFTKPLPLIAGNIYVIQVEEAFPPNFFWVGTLGDVYPRGSAILEGEIVSKDLGFATYFDPKVRVTRVGIDIKPGSDRNPINPKSEGVIPVAILSSHEFDATKVYKQGLGFGKTGTERSLAFCNGNHKDVNSDGLLDLVCHFNSEKTGFSVGDTAGILRGNSVADIPIIGTDSVAIVGENEGEANARGKAR